MKQNIFLRKYCKLTLIIMLFAIQTTVSQAQMRPRNKIDSVQAWNNGYWYRADHYQFETQYSKPTHIPPSSASITSEIGLAYLYLDTLMKSVNVCDFLTMSRYWINNKIKNDTNIAMIKYLYKLVDNDPVSFNQYLENQDMINSYKTSLNVVQSTTQEILGSLVPNYPLHFAMADLINADYILRVHVNSVISLPWIEYPNRKVFLNEYVYQVNATVLDTLKGKVFQNCNSPQSLVVKQSGNHIQSDASYICFNYVTGSYSNYETKRIIDRSLQDTTVDLYPKNLKLSPGQDLIVFISHNCYLWDYNYDYFDIGLNTVIPVINGQVIDNNYEWSDSLKLDYSDWKNAFQQKVNMLLNGGY